MDAWHLLLQANSNTNVITGLDPREAPPEGQELRYLDPL